jgi:secreted trypsin-like serine protease
MQTSDTTPRTRRALRRALFVVLVVGLLATVVARPASSARAPWRPERPAIVNGTATTESTYASRWTAMAAVVTSSAWGSSLCGGALVDSRTVVTAAHCTLDPAGSPLAATSVEVVVGRRVASSSTGDRIDVERVTRHPSFSRTTLRNDIAVLRLARTPAVVVGALQVTSAADESWWGAGAGRAQSGGLVGPWIAGWGATTTSGGGWPDALQEATVPIAADATCAGAAAPGHGTSFDPATMICAGLVSSVAGAGVDTCQGDSGGPLVVGDGAGGWRLVGLTSWGRECAGRHLGVYTRVGRYVDWLEPLRDTPSQVPLEPTSPPPATPPPGSPSPSPGGPAPSGSAVGPIVIDPTSDGSPPAVVETPSTSPTPPRFVRVRSPRQGVLVMTWRGARPAAEYLVQHRTTRGWRRLRRVRGTRIVVHSLRPGRVLLLRVRARAGSGPWSPPSTIVRARVR